MRTRILPLVALILALGNSIVAAQTLPAHLRSAPASAIIGRILAGRDQFGLKADQVARLTRLEEQLRHSRAALTGLDRVPGKSVPRFERILPSAAEAFRQALSVLDPDQRARATRLLDSPSR